VSVRGRPPAWEAIPILNPIGNAERRAAVRIAAIEMQREFDLKAE
jgi:hypothetical protein